MHYWHQTFRQNGLFISQDLYKLRYKVVAETIRIGTVLIPACAGVNKCYIQAQHEKY